MTQFLASCVSLICAEWGKDFSDYRNMQWVNNTLDTGQNATYINNVQIDEGG